MKGEKKPVQQLAIDLFMYSFYNEGLKFGPNSFGNFFSTQFVTSFPKFINKLRFIGGEITESTYFSKYLEQFIANHYYECVPKVSVSQDDIKEGNFVAKENGNLIIKASLVSNPNGHVTSAEGVKMRGSYERIIYNENLYHITDATRGNTSFVEYTPAPMNLRDELRYNAKSDAFETMEYESDANRVSKAKSINSNSVLAGNTERQLESNPMYDMDFDSWDEMLADMEEQFSSEEQQEDYNPSEGQQQLDDPMCIRHEQK